MNNNWNKIGIFVKVMKKVLMRWKNWSDFKALLSIQFQGEDWSKIETLSLNSQARFRNYRTKLTAWNDIQEIFKMLNQYAVDNPTLPVNQCFSPPHPDPGGMLSRSVGMPSRSNGPPSIWDTHGISGNVFWKSNGVFFSTWSARVKSIYNVSEHTSPHVMSECQTPAQDQRCQSGPSAKKFSHLQWRRLFKELWGRPTTTADFGSSFWQISHVNNVRLLEDKIQDWGMYLFTISNGSYAADHRSGVGWFSGWSQIFVFCKRNSNAKFLKYSMRRSLQHWTESSVIPNSRERSVWRNKKPEKRTLSFVEDRSLTWSTSTSGSLEPTLLSIIMPTYLQLFFEMRIFRNSIQNGTEFWYQWRKSHLMTS